MMKKLLKLLLTLASLFVTPTFAASMLGDTVTIHRYYPAVGVDYESPVDTVVTTGSGDAVIWGTHTDINPEANSITFASIAGPTYIGLGAEFDGYEFTGFSKDIVSVGLVNDSNLLVALSHTSRSILMDLQGTHDAGKTFIVNVDFATPVPEPYSFVLLLAGLAALVALRKVSSRSVTGR